MSPLLALLLSATFVEGAPLESGLRVIAAPRPGAPIAAVGLVIAGGVALDDQAKGRALLALSLHFGRGEGTERKDLAKALSKSGSDFGFAVNADHALVYVVGLADQVEQMVKLLALAVEGPQKLTKEEFEARRMLLVDQLWETKKSPLRYARHQLPGLLFGARHPYGRSSLGTRRTLGPMSLAGVERHLEQTVCPDRSAVVAAGGIDPERVRELVGRRFASWARCRGEASPKIRFPTLLREVVPIVHDPGRAQAVIFGALAVGAANAEEIRALQILTEALGGSATSRLQVALREEGGVTYGAYSRLDVRRGGGVIEVRTSVDPKRAGVALSRLTAVIDDLRARPPAGAELTRARRRLASARAVALGAPESVLRAVGARLGAGLSLEPLEASPETLSRMAEAFSSDRLQLVLVGDGRTLPSVVKEKGLGTPRLFRVR